MPQCAHYARNVHLRRIIAAKVCVTTSSPHAIVQVVKFPTSVESSHLIYESRVADVVISKNITPLCWRETLVS